MAKSTLFPLCPSLLDSGGYAVQPVPTPLSTIEERSNKTKAGGSNQKERLFIRGKDISGAPSIIGRNQFPKPPIKIGITMKKIIKKAWAVTITLYIWSLPINCVVVPSSNRIRPEKAAPRKPPVAPNIK